MLYQHSAQFGNFGGTLKLLFHLIFCQINAVFTIYSVKSFPVEIEKKADQRRMTFKSLTIEN